MYFKVLEEMKGVEKEYKAILRISRHGYWEDIEREKPYNVDTFNRMLKELNNMEIEMPINGIETNVKLVIETNERESPLLIMTMKVNREKYIYKDEKKFEKMGEDKEFLELVHIENVVEDFKKQIQNFKMAVNISYPGLLEVYGVEIYINGIKEFNSNNVLSSLLISVNEAKRDNWPKMEIIDIKRTWNWLKKRKSFINGMSSNAIERALCALSYIYDCYSYEDLFYAMIGIEAIYARNKEGILQQIKEKSRAIFGEPSDYMKRLKHMYNVRSRFIHGELNFPPRYCMDGDTKEFIEFADKQYFDSKNFAQAILISSIQQFVIRDTDEIEFELKVKN